MFPLEFTYVPFGQFCAGAAVAGVGTTIAGAAVAGATVAGAAVTGGRVTGTVCRTVVGATVIGATVAGGSVDFGVRVAVVVVRATVATVEADEASGVDFTADFADDPQPARATNTVAHIAARERQPTVPRISAPASCKTSCERMATTD